MEVKIKFSSINRQKWVGVDMKIKNSGVDSPSLLFFHLMLFIPEIKFYYKSKPVVHSLSVSVIWHRTH